MSEKIKIKEQPSDTINSPVADHVSYDVFKSYQAYFEQQQKIVLNYWTQVLNSMWGIK